MTSKNLYNLTEKQKRFADYFIETGNATESYSKAYKADAKVCESNGCRLLRNAKIKAYIDQNIAKKDEKRIMKQDEILELLTELARGNLTEEVINVISKGDFKQYIKITDKNISHKDRLKALELLAKRYRMFDDNLDNQNRQVIIVNDIDEIEDG